MSESVKLNELNYDDWFDVARILKPEMTREQFELWWSEFQARKARRNRVKPQ